MQLAIQYLFCLSEYKCPIGLGNLNRYFGQRFDSAQLHLFMGLQWFRRSIRKITEAGSVRAKTQTLTKSLVSLVKQHQLLLDQQEMGLYQPYKPNDTRSLEGLFNSKEIIKWQ